MEKILQSQTIFQGRKFEVKRLTIEIEPGRTVEWEVVHKGGNSVAMVPIDDEGNVYLVEEYFAATDERTLCLPKGMIDEGETPQDAALRELQEEIGMRGSLQHLVDMSVSPGYLTQKTILFLVTSLRPSKLEGDEKLHIKPVKLPVAEALDKVRMGQITEARTIGGLALAMLVISKQE